MQNWLKQLAADCPPEDLAQLERAIHKGATMSVKHLATIRRRIAAGDTADEIAERIGVTRDNLYKICHRNGITVPRRRTYTPNLERMAEKLRAAGYTVVEPE